MRLSTDCATTVAMAMPQSEPCFIATSDSTRFNKPVRPMTVPATRMPLLPERIASWMPASPLAVTARFRGEGHLQGERGGFDGIGLVLPPDLHEQIVAREIRQRRAAAEQRLKLIEPPHLHTHAFLILWDRSRPSIG